MTANLNCHFNLIVVRYLGARVKHAADVGPDAVTDILKSTMMPLGVAGVTTEGLRCRV